MAPPSEVIPLPVARTVYRDFDEFSDALRGLSGRFIPTARPASSWWIEDIHLGQTSIQQLQMGGAATFAGDGKPHTLTVGVPLTDPRGMRIDGHTLEPDAFLLSRCDRPFTLTQVDVSRWATVTVPSHFFGKLVRDEHICRRAHPDRITRVQVLVMSALEAKESLDASPATRAAAESEISLVLADTLEHSETLPSDRQVGRPQFSRSRVVARTLALLEASEGQTLLIEDLCRATEVSERTLRAIFHEYFGVGPIRLLKLRQLREIRAALLRADARCDTVTRIAARFGIWDFSQFARSYKALFGESPSRTLRAPPIEHRLRSSISWLQCASR